MNRIIATGLTALALAGGVVLGGGIASAERPVHQPVECYLIFGAQAPAICDLVPVFLPPELSSYIDYAPPVVDTPVVVDTAPAVDVPVIDTPPVVVDPAPVDTAPIDTTPSVTGDTPTVTVDTPPVVVDTAPVVVDAAPAVGGV